MAWDCQAHLALRDMYTAVATRLMGFLQSCLEERVPVVQKVTREMQGVQDQLGQRAIKERQVTSTASMKPC